MAADADDWPIVKYNKPLKIVQQDWKRQKEILNSEECPLFYEESFNPVGDIQWEK